MTNRTEISALLVIIGLWLPPKTVFRTEFGYFHSQFAWSGLLINDIIYLWNWQFSFLSSLSRKLFSSFFPMEPLAHEHFWVRSDLSTCRRDQLMKCRVGIFSSLFNLSIISQKWWNRSIYWITFINTTLKSKCTDFLKALLYLRVQGKNHVDVAPTSCKNASILFIHLKKNFPRNHSCWRFLISNQYILIPRCAANNWAPVSFFPCRRTCHPMCRPFAFYLYECLYFKP